MTNFILSIPPQDLANQPDAFTTFEGVDTPLRVELIQMAGGREFNGKVLALCNTTGDLAQAIVDSNLSWTIWNTGLNITGGDVLDLIADKQDVDGNGDPVGAPYRPVTVPPLTKFYGDADWVIA